MPAATLDEVDDQLRSIISSLYMLLVQAHEYQGQDTQRAMSTEIRTLVQNLQSLSLTAQRLPTHLPLDVIRYVEGSRNPDIYTREMVELCMRYNQEQKGRAEAYSSFRDILASKIAVGIPDIKDDVKAVVEAAGGRLE